MTFDELRTECDEAEAAGLTHVPLIAPPRGRLPWRGELLCESDRGRVYRIPIKAIRRSLAKAGE
jgi:hypothetical protein